MDSKLMYIPNDDNKIIPFVLLVGTFNIQPIEPINQNLSTQSCWANEWENLELV